MRCYRAGSTRWDHPRVRGEQLLEELGDVGGVGPSPRARGAVGLPVRLPERFGTIPACAGSRGPRHRMRGSVRDHPRVRGEQRLPRAAWARARGPSPRARGAAERGGPFPRRLGTIPACAGSSGSGSGRYCAGRDHPRVRGEQSTLSWTGLLEGGPSPRARGADSAAPASGGAVGPSPRARGAGVHSFPAASLDGTIPACAGSSCQPRSRQQDRGDHPRVRGEQQRPVQHVVRGGGTIPACAGSRLAELRVYRC